MQEPDNAELAAAITRAVRRPVWRVLVDWDGDQTWDHPLTDLSPWVNEDGLEVEVALTSDIPAEASLVNGWTGGSAKVVLSGRYEGEPIASVFSPYREPGGPLDGVQLLGVTAQIALGVDTGETTLYLPQLTGPVRAVDISSDGRIVELTISDPSDQLRAPITLPFWALPYDAAIEPEAHPVETTTHWVVSHILRKNGWGAPIRPDTFCSVTFHGGLVPEVGQSHFLFGRVENLPAGESFWTEGPHGWLAARARDQNEPDPLVTRVVCDAIPQGIGVGFSCWVYVGPDVPWWPDGEIRYFTLAYPGTGDGDRIDFGISGDGRMFLGIGWSEPFTVLYDNVQAAAGYEEGWHYVAGWIRYTPATNDIQAVIRFDHVIGDVAGNLAVDFSPEWRPYTVVDTWHQVAVSDLTWWASFDPPETDEDWPGYWYSGDHAGVDRGVNKLTYLPTRTGVDSWELLQEIAAAEHGVVGFDAIGRPFFRDRGSLDRDLSTVEKTITPRRELKTLGVGLSADTVRNVMEYETTPAYVRDLDVVFEAVSVDQFFTPAGATRDFEVWLRPQTMPYEAVLEIPKYRSEDWLFWRDSPEGLPIWGCVPVVADQPELDIIGVSILAIPTGSRTLIIRVNNTSISDLILAAQPEDSDGNPSGDPVPALRVPGWPITLEEPRVERVQAASSIAKYRERSLRVEGGDWLQLRDTVREFKNGLVAELAEPRPILPGIEVVGDPRVELGDTLEIRDPGGLGPSFRASVVEIRRRLDRRGLVDVYGLRPAPITT